MGSRPPRQKGARIYTVRLTETFHNDPARAELGLQLWRRFLLDPPPTVKPVVDR